MKAPETDLEKRSFWQLVFLQSKVNGAAYDGEQLPRRNWNWPKNTYFQQRVRRAKWYQPREKRYVELGEKLREATTLFCEVCDSWISG